MTDLELAIKVFGPEAVSTSGHGRIWVDTTLLNYERPEHCIELIKYIAEFADGGQWCDAGEYIKFGNTQALIDLAKELAQ